MRSGSRFRAAPIALDCPCHACAADGADSAAGVLVGTLPAWASAGSPGTAGGAGTAARDSAGIATRAPILCAPGGAPAGGHGHTKSGRRHHPRRAHHKRHRHRKHHRKRRTGPVGCNPCPCPRCAEGKACPMLEPACPSPPCQPTTTGTTSTQTATTNTTITTRHIDHAALPGPPVRDRVHNHFDDIHDLDDPGRIRTGDLMPEKREAHPSSRDRVPIV